MTEQTEARNVGGGMRSGIVESLSRCRLRVLITSTASARTRGGQAPALWAVVMIPVPSGLVITR
jgi:hypothetical protein